MQSHVMDYANAPSAVQDSLALAAPPRPPKPPSVGAGGTLTNTNLSSLGPSGLGPNANVSCAFFFDIDIDRIGSGFSPCTHYYSVSLSLFNLLHFTNYPLV